VEHQWRQTGAFTGSRRSATAHARYRQCDVLLPGFIDLRVHGGAGRAFSDGAVATLASEGVTTCYAGLGAGPTLLNDQLYVEATIMRGVTSYRREAER
jgi:N-acetylglucosamine-6-phosphate deacetylase